MPAWCRCDETSSPSSSPLPSPPRPPFLSPCCKGTKLAWISKRSVGFDLVSKFKSSTVLVVAGIGANARRMEKGERKPMRGVLAYANVTLGGGGIAVDASQAVANRMKDMGAETVPKLQRKVTHVVFQGGQEALSKLFAQIDRCWKEKTQPRPSVVSTNWIERVAETEDLNTCEFEVERPKEESFTARLLLSNTTIKSKKRKRTSTITPLSRTSSPTRRADGPFTNQGTSASAADTTTRKLFFSPPRKVMKFSSLSPHATKNIHSPNSVETSIPVGAEASAPTSAQARKQDMPVEERLPSDNCGQGRQGNSACPGSETYGASGGLVNREVIVID